MELQGSDESDKVAQLGYDFIIVILYPYLTEDAKKDLYDSYNAIKLATSDYFNRNRSSSFASFSGCSRCNM